MTRATLEEIHGHLDKASEIRGNRFNCCCPAHDDKNPSLSVEEISDGAQLFYCHSGCDQDAILGEIRRRVNNFDPRPDGMRDKRHQSQTKSPKSDEKFFERGLLVPPHDTPPPDFGRLFPGQAIEHIYKYVDQYGRTVGYIVRLMEP